MPDNREDILVPGVPGEDTAFDDFDSWTVGLIREAVKAYARAAGSPAEHLPENCIAAATRRRNEAMEEERKSNMLLERERRKRVLLDPRRLDTITRYEAGCERSLFKNLHALERLQAARRGAIVSPPETIEVDLNVQTVDLDQSDRTEEERIEESRSIQDLPFEKLIDGASDNREREGTCPTENQISRRIWYVIRKMRNEPTEL